MAATPKPVRQKKKALDIKLKVALKKHMPEKVSDVMKQRKRNSKVHKETLKLSDNKY